MKILISGYYGYKNLGDELILSSIIGDIRSIALDAEIVVWSGDPAYTEKVHGVRGIDRSSPEATRDAVHSADIVVVGGGGLIHEHFRLDIADLFLSFGSSLASYAAVPVMAKSLQKPLFYWAHGVGPFFSEDGLAFAKWFYSLADVVTVRDPSSYALLSDLCPDMRHLFLDSDPVTHLDLGRFIKPGRFPLPPERIKIGINMRHWNNIDRTVTVLASVLEELYSHKREIMIVPVPFDLSYDKNVLRRFLDLLPTGSVFHYSFEDLEEPAEVLSLMKDLTVFLGMRLHALMVGRLLGIPALALSYDTKVDEYADLSSTPVIRLDEASPRLFTDGIRELLGRVASGETKSAPPYRTPRIFRDFSEGAIRARKGPIEHAQPPSSSNLHLVRSLMARIADLEHERDDLRLLVSRKDAVIAERDRKIETLTMENNDLSNTLQSVYHSKTWRLGQLYGKLFYRTRFDRLLTKMLGTTILKQQPLPVQEEPEKIGEIVLEASRRAQKGVVIMTSSVEFNEFFNQRSINLSKALSHFGYSVLFIGWRWSPDQAMENSFAEVFPGVFQVPVDDFVRHVDSFARCDHDRRFFIVEFPHPDFLRCMLHLKDAGFVTLYDIIDDWEAFHAVAQAPWFDKEYEDALVVNADTLTAVSPPLCRKFGSLRKDITLIPNGFSPALLGDVHPGDRPQRDDNSVITIGYFGHLTDSWFDWDMVFRAAEENRDFHFHLIGYGESAEMRNKLSGIRNMTFYGKIHPSSLRSYAADWDVAMLPFRDGALSRSVDPIKIYEYLHFGLPTVVQGIPHLDGIPAVKTCRGLDEFVTAIRSLGEGRRKGSLPRAEMEDFLKNSTWDRRTESMVHSLEKHLP